MSEHEQGRHLNTPVKTPRSQTQEHPVAAGFFSSVVSTDATKLPLTSPLTQHFSELFFCVANINQSHARALQSGTVPLMVLLI